MRWQYVDDVRLRTRIDTHARYGTNPIPFQRWVLDQLAPIAGCALLDAGCGYGHVYHRLLLESAVTPVGLDLSMGMLRQTAATSTPVQGDLGALPFPDAAFDRVMCNHALYHASDRRAALDELARVTRRRGRVVVSTNSGRSLASLNRIVQEAAQRTGRDHDGMQREPFNLESVAEVRAVFPTAEVREFRNPLVFPSPEGVVAYVASSVEPGNDDFLTAVEELAAAVVAREGAFRTETIAGCFVADV